MTETVNVHVNTDRQVGIIAELKSGFLAQLVISHQEFIAMRFLAGEVTRENAVRLVPNCLHPAVIGRCTKFLMTVDHWWVNTIVGIEGYD